MTENRTEKKIARRVAEVLGLNYTGGLRWIRKHPELDVRSMTDEEIRKKYMDHNEAPKLRRKL